MQDMQRTKLIFPRVKWQKFLANQAEQVAMNFWLLIILCHRWRLWNSQTDNNCNRHKISVNKVKVLRASCINMQLTQAYTKIMQIVVTQAAYSHSSIAQVHNIISFAQSIKFQAPCLLPAFNLAELVRNIQTRSLWKQVKMDVWVSDLCVEIYIGTRSETRVCHDLCALPPFFSSPIIPPSLPLFSFFLSHRAHSDDVMKSWGRSRSGLQVRFPFGLVQHVAMAHAHIHVLARAHTWKTHVNSPRERRSKITKLCTPLDRQCQRTQSSIPTLLAGPRQRSKLYAWW